MYAKFVEIDGQKIWITCTPDTPLSEVLMRAADQMRIREKIARDNHPDMIAYRAARRLLDQTSGMRE